MNYDAKDRAVVRNIIAKSAIGPDNKTAAEDLALALLAGGETPEEAAKFAISRAKSDKVEK
ncbi:MAG: hypothetical protein RR101_13255 [Burkholderiaceae bacterium]